MRIVDCYQGTPEWFSARMGIPTASSAHLIVTPKTGKLSASARAYAYRLVAERLLRQPTESLEATEWMARGKELEPVAVRQYEFTEEVETEAVGFCLSDDGTMGASPDRLIKGCAAGLEVKCPAPHTHIGYLLDGHDDAYRPQIQMQMLVCDFERVDFYSYSERMPPALIRTPRDEPYIALMRAALAEFSDRLAEMTERARRLGVFQARAEARTPLEIERAAELERRGRDELVMPPPAGEDDYGPSPFT